MFGDCPPRFPPLAGGESVALSSPADEGIHLPVQLSASCRSGPARPVRVPYQARSRTVPTIPPTALARSGLRIKSRAAGITASHSSSVLPVGLWWLCLVSAVRTCLLFRGPAPRLPTTGPLSRTTGRMGIFRLQRLRVRLVIRRGGCLMCCRCLRCELTGDCTEDAVTDLKVHQGRQEE